MHEASLVQGLLHLVAETVKDYVTANPGKAAPRIQEIICQAGLLACFEPAALEACFEIFRENTVAQNATLTVETVPLECHCTACGKDFTLQSRQFRCPFCGDGQIKFSGGTGLVLKAIRAEEDDNG